MTCCSWVCYLFTLRNKILCLENKGPFTDFTGARYYHRHKYKPFFEMASNWFKRWKKALISAGEQLASNGATPEHRLTVSNVVQGPRSTTRAAKNQKHPEAMKMGSWQKAALGAFAGNSRLLSADRATVFHHCTRGNHW